MPVADRWLIAKSLSRLAYSAANWVTLNSSDDSFSTFCERLFQTTSFALAMLLGLCGSAIVSRAQDPDDVVRTEVSLVQLNVGVVNREGRAITSLSRNDFAVYEDGVKQSISQFEPTNAPFSLVLLLDVSGSTINFRPQLKLATQRFLDALAPEDRVAVDSV